MVDEKVGMKVSLKVVTKVGMLAVLLADKKVGMKAVSMVVMLVVKMVAWWDYWMVEKKVV